MGVGVGEAVSILPDRRCVLLPSIPTTVGVIRFLLVVEPTCPCPCPCTALDAELGAKAMAAFAGDSAVRRADAGSVRSIASAPLLSTVMLSLTGRITAESVISVGFVIGSVAVEVGSTWWYRQGSALFTVSGTSSMSSGSPRKQKKAHENK